MNDVRTRRYPLPRMEGALARWYARNRGSSQQLQGYRREAARLSGQVPPGAQILEVAPGPGYLAIELARCGAQVTGLDISTSIVRLAGEQARRCEVPVDFQYGDVAAMPFPDERFDLIVCQAAFKNFADPVGALDEMYRVLRPGGTAVIQDMNRHATGADITAEVGSMRVGRLDGVLTRAALTVLRLRALAPDRFEQLAAASRFGGCAVTTSGLGLEVRLTR